MFPLASSRLPETAKQLSDALNESLRRLVSVSADPVTIQDDKYPRLTSLDVVLDRGELLPNPPAPPKVATTSPALQVDRFNISAQHFSVGPAQIDLTLKANQVELRQGKAHDGDQIVLTLGSAKKGDIDVSIATSDLEGLIKEIAQKQAGKQGVTIDDVSLEIETRGPRSVQAEVRLRARKLFLSATILIGASLQIDDELNAKLSDLACRGDGALGKLACGVLAPHLQKLNEREFSLMALPLGDVQLHDVQIAVDDRLAVHAKFGSA